MRNVIVGLVLAVVAGAAMAEFEYATYQGNDMPVGTTTRCYYRSMSGFEFSINVKGACPGSVQVDSETGQVRK